MSELKCMECENRAMFSLRTKSIFDYNTDAFYVDGIYCHNHYCQELMRIHNGMRSTMTPDYKALSNREREMESSAGTVQVMQEPEPLSQSTMKEEPIVIVQIDDKVQQEEEEERIKIERMASKELKQKNLEEKVKNAILEVGILNSYEVARYIHEPRGTVWNCIKRLDLTDKLNKKTRKSYNRFAKNEKTTE